MKKRKQILNHQFNLAYTKMLPIDIQINKIISDRAVIHRGLSVHAHCIGISLSRYIKTSIPEDQD